MADFIELVIMLVIGAPLMLGLILVRNAYYNRRAEELSARLGRLYNRRAKIRQRAKTLEELMEV